MSDTGDRLVSATCVTDPDLIRPWSMDLDSLPNQGQLDTSVPAHAVDLDAIQRAGMPAHVDAWLAERYAHPRPSVVHRRRRRDWRQVLGRAAWWCAERAPAAIAILFAFLLAHALLRGSAL